MKSQFKIIISLFIAFIVLALLISFFTQKKTANTIRKNHQAFGHITFKGTIKDIILLSEKGDGMLRVDLVSSSKQNYDTRKENKAYTFVIKDNKAEIITYFSGEQINDTVIFFNDKIYIKRKNKILNSYYPILNSNSFPRKTLEKEHNL